MANTKKIIFMTATGSYNLGDELILKQEVEYIRTRYPNTEIVVFTHDERSSMLYTRDVRYVTYFPSGLSKNFFGNIGFLWNNFKEIKSASMVIIGGGGLFYDNEDNVSFSKQIWQWGLRLKIARIFGVPVFFWGISLEIKGANNKSALKKIFYPGDSIAVRDDKSFGLLDALEIPSQVMYDSVFLYAPVPSTEAPPTKKRVGISVRGGFLGDSESYIPRLYEYLEQKGYDPVFLVHSTAGSEEQNDMLFIRKIMQGRRFNMTESIEQTLKIYPTLFAVIGMRYHSGILACVHELPLLMISYGPKTEELVKLMKVKEFISDPKEMSWGKIESLWENLESNADIRKAEMEAVHTSIVSTLLKQIQNI